jgi:hypothetical protein
MLLILSFQADRIPAPAAEATKIQAVAEIAIK